MGALQPEMAESGSPSFLLLPTAPIEHILELIMDALATI